MTAPCSILGQGRLPSTRESAARSEPRLRNSNKKSPQGDYHVPRCRTRHFLSRLSDGAAVSRQHCLVDRVRKTPVGPRGRRLPYLALLGGYSHVPMDGHATGLTHPMPRAVPTSAIVRGPFGTDFAMLAANASPTVLGPQRRESGSAAIASAKQTAACLLLNLARHTMDIPTVRCKMPVGADATRN